MRNFRDGNSEPGGPEGSGYEGLQRQLLREIEEEFRFTASMTGCEAPSPAVHHGFMSVLRHRFIAPAERDDAYRNRPIPIDGAQTMTAPFIVALTLDVLDVMPSDIVLEIGTGSGFQAAVLATVARRVHSLEIQESLATSAAALIDDLKISNLHIHAANGASGWPDSAPFDRIVVNAAVPAIPQALIDQLAPGGRLVAPLGMDGSQRLVLVEKKSDGKTSERSVLPVNFSALTGASADLDT